jgi:hypothetical protein
MDCALPLIVSTSAVNGLRCLAQGRDMERSDDAFESFFGSRVTMVGTGLIAVSTITVMCQIMGIL